MKYITWTSLIVGLWAVGMMEQYGLALYWLVIVCAAAAVLSVKAQERRERQQRHKVKYIRYGKGGRAA